MDTQKKDLKQEGQEGQKENLQEEKLQNQKTSQETCNKEDLKDKEKEKGMKKNEDGGCCDK